MDDFEEETLKKNPSKQKPISYSTEFRLDNNLNKFVGMINAFQDIYILSIYKRDYSTGGHNGSLI